ncbi:MAG: GNAT family protein, partial [Pseudomonadota bacterium]
MGDHTSPLGLPIGAPLSGWNGAKPPRRVTLTGERCRLEPFDTVTHGQALGHAFSGTGCERLWTYISYGPFATPDDWLRWMETQAASDDPLFFAIVDSATGQAVGQASLLRIDSAAGVIEVGHIVYAPALKRTVAATEAMFLLMRYAFDELGYRRYEWKCDALNAASRRAAERLGFSFEGVFRQATVYKGRNRDTAWYALLDGDWPATRLAFERWLSPDNRDADGQQRAALG